MKGGGTINEDILFIHVEALRHTSSVKEPEVGDCESAQTWSCSGRHVQTPSAPVVLYAPNSGTISPTSQPVDGNKDGDGPAGQVPLGLTKICMHEDAGVRRRSGGRKGAHHVERT